jgi:hypothetical protein
VNGLAILAGLLLLLWPAQFWMSGARHRARAEQRGADPARVGRPAPQWLRVLLVVSPAIGVLLVVGGLTGVI